MRLRKADWLFVLAAALLVLFVSLLPSPRDRNPPVPRTLDHQGLAWAQDCLQLPCRRWYEALTPSASNAAGLLALS